MGPERTSKTSRPMYPMTTGITIMGISSSGWKIFRPDGRLISASATSMPSSSSSASSNAIMVPVIETAPKKSLFFSTEMKF